MNMLQEPENMEDKEGTQEYDPSNQIHLFIYFDHLVVGMQNVRKL